MEDYTPTLSEEERAARRAQRAEARRQKQRARRQRQLKQLLPFCLVLVILVGLLTAWGFQHQPEESGLPYRDLLQFQKCLFHHSVFLLS